MAETIHGISKEKAEKKLGFLMYAIKYSTPQHDGIAFGFDRWVMIFAGETPIHNTIVFPKTTRAISLMEDSPPGVRLRCTRLKCYSKWSL
jgi:aspartyl-tRNA synthetase